MECRPKFSISFSVFYSPSSILLLSVFFFSRFVLSEENLSSLRYYSALRVLCIFHILKTRHMSFLSFFFLNYLAPLSSLNWVVRFDHKKRKNGRKRNCDTSNSFQATNGFSFWHEIVLCWSRLSGVFRKAMYGLWPIAYSMTIAFSQSS